MCLVKAFGECVRRTTVVCPVMSSTEDPRPRHQFSFSNVSWTVKIKGTDKRIIQKVGATIESGRVLAIMGPSVRPRPKLPVYLTPRGTTGLLVANEPAISHSQAFMVRR